MIFNETQKFDSKILWFMRISLVLTLLILASALVFTDGAMNILIISIVAIVCVPVFLILEICQLKTEVDTDGIRLNFRPFTKKSYAWSDVETAELIDYGFVGGWGIRLGTKYGTVYNTKGREGLWLTFNDGKKIVIGTQRKAAMKSTVQKVFHRN